jgi:twitching motility protein PilT
MYMPNPTGENPMGVGTATAPAPQPVTVGQARSLEDIHIDELLYIVVEKGRIRPASMPLCGACHPRGWTADASSTSKKASPSDTQRLIYDILTDEQIQRFENHL